MSRNQMGENVNSIPMEQMVAAPIIAAEKAQQEVGGMLAKYLDTVVSDSKGNIPNLSVETVQVNFSDSLSHDSEQTRQINVKMAIPTK